MLLLLVYSFMVVMTFLIANICIGSTYAKTQKRLIKVENSVKETLEKS